MTKRDWLGCILIVICVVFIGLGGSMTDDDDSSETDPKTYGDDGEKVKYLIFAVGMAMLLGLIFSFNTLNVNYIIQDVKFSPNQMNYDGNFVYGLFLIVPFAANIHVFDAEDIIKANVAIILVTCAINFFSFAIQCGKGGSVQAIENLKSVV